MLTSELLAPGMPSQTARPLDGTPPPCAVATLDGARTTRAPGRAMPSTTYADHEKTAVERPLARKWRRLQIYGFRAGNGHEHVCLQGDMWPPPAGLARAAPASPAKCRDPHERQARSASSVSNPEWELRMYTHTHPIGCPELWVPTSLSGVGVYPGSVCQCSSQMRPHGIQIDSI